jgi:hypothetical protein
MSMKKRVVFVGDNHGDLIDKRDAKVFLDFCKDFKPHHKIHLGDNFDFRNIRKGVEPEEEMDDPEPDFTAGMLFLERYQPTVFLCGNHDHRLWRMLTSTKGLLRQYARTGIKQIMDELDSMKCRFLPYDVWDGEYRLGDASFVHGYTCGMQAVKQTAMTYRRTIVMGHLHRNELMASPTTGRIFGMSVGGLGNHKKMNYARHRFATLAWSPGFGYGYHNERTDRVELFPMFKQGTLWPITKAT